MATRREFLTAAGGTVGLTAAGDFAFLNLLPPVHGAQLAPGRALASVAGDVEPLVRLIEETRRDRLIEAVARRVKDGTSYQELMAAVMLAGVRGIQPRPVGFKFHAVLVINSAHQASIAARDQDRWLPLFWAIDNFKGSQERNSREGDWRMAPVEEGRLPAATQAGTRFREAMDNWDVTAADTAIAAWARSGGANEIYEAMWRYGARDFRDIGHKAIYVANSFRTLQTIGWRHAEPILRSLAFALLDHEGTNPARRDAPADRPWRDNIERVRRIREGWQRGRVSREATVGLVEALREANPSDASQRVLTMLNDEVDPASVWDGLFLRAGECLMQQPGIVGLHTVTTMNALYFAYHNSANDETRRMMMLQGAAYLVLFREAMAGRGMVHGDRRLDRIEPQETTGRGAAAIEEIFTDANRDRMVAARKTLNLLVDEPDQMNALMTQARRLIFSKGNDSHDYKFSSACLEDFFHTTNGVRNRFLASGMFYLKGAGGADTPLYRRIRAALEE
jgi:hypothetical protein